MEPSSKKFINPSAKAHSLASGSPASFTCSIVVRIVLSSRRASRLRMRANSSLSAAVSVPVVVALLLVDIELEVSFVLVVTCSIVEVAGAGVSSVVVVSIAVLSPAVVASWSGMPCTRAA